MTPGSGLLRLETYHRLLAWENGFFTGENQVEDARGTRLRQAAVVVGIVFLSLLHWSLPPSKQVHNLIYHFDFIPIVVAGMLFGARGAGVATAITAGVELPQIWVMWGRDLVYTTDQAGELAVSGIAGYVVGFLADRERQQSAKLAGATRELEKVYMELRENLERLRKAERLSAVAQLSANLAHEIRNPLAGISGAAGILKRGNAPSENIQECLEIIERESQRLNKLLTNFLDFARPRTPRLQPTNLADVIDSVVALASHSPGGGKIEFRCVLASGLPEVECDAEQLKQVLLNLVINAIQATKEGVVELDASVDQEWAVIKVRDQGVGISLEAQEHLFDPFFTTKDQGTGLGLAIASKIVEQHDGRLQAVSVPGRGAEMIVQLPLTRKVPA